MKAGTEELARTLGEVIDTVDSMNSTDIGENEFRTTYLPLILAIHSGEKPQIQGWAYRTGSVYNGFRVISDSTGEILFTTPGIYVQNTLTIDAGFTPMLQDVANASRNKMSSENIYSEHLNSDKAKLHIGDSSTHLLGWYKIFARYGYKMARTDGTSTLPNKEVPVEKLPSLDWGEDEFA